MRMAAIYRLVLVLSLLFGTGMLPVGDASADTTIFGVPVHGPGWIENGSSVPVWGIAKIGKKICRCAQDDNLLPVLVVKNRYRPSRVIPM